MLRLIAKEIRKVVDEIANFRNGYPPLAFTPSLAPVSSGVGASGASYGLSDLINDMRILLGVPKYRTSKPKKVTRKFSYTRLLSPVEDLVSCQSCGSKHHVDTICGTCYSKVRELTNTIKKEMMNYNPYKGEKNDKKIFIKFSDDKEIDEGVVDGKRVIELKQERPTWFKKIVQ